VKRGQTERSEAGGEAVRQDAPYPCSGQTHISDHKQSVRTSS